MKLQRYIYLQETVQKIRLNNNTIITQNIRTSDRLYCSDILYWEKLIFEGGVGKNVISFQFCSPLSSILPVKPTKMHSIFINNYIIILFQSRTTLVLSNHKALKQYHDI